MAQHEHPGWWRCEGGRCLLQVHVQPGAVRSEVAGLHGDRLKIRVAAPATEDRANQALLRFLAAEFGVSLRSVRLVSGARSRAKRVAIEGAVRRPRWLAGAP